MNVFTDVYSLVSPFTENKVQRASRITIPLFPFTIAVVLKRDNKEIGETAVTVCAAPVNKSAKRCLCCKFPMLKFCKFPVRARLKLQYINFKGGQSRLNTFHRFNIVYMLQWPISYRRTDGKGQHRKTHSETAHDILYWGLKYTKDKNKHVVARI